jgi:thiosulfate dehydrogenase
MRIRTAFVGATLALLASMASAQACREPGAYDRPVDAVALGGRLYDNWYAACGLPAPKDTHPAYPSIGKQSGASTWRCKECHGWDYAGKDGAYAKGSHYTGIGGISGAAGRPVTAIVAVLSDDRHRFDTVLAAPELERLARFVSQGQSPLGRAVDADTKKVSGPTAGGARTFMRECASCHGVRGRRLNFAHGQGDPEFVGTIAVENPWEAWHKIRHGQPGSVMDREHLALEDPDVDRRGHMMGGGMHRHMMEGRAMPAFGGPFDRDQLLALMRFLQTLPTR